jgi:hypothetical protein
LLPYSSWYCCRLWLLSPLLPVLLMMLLLLPYAAAATAAVAIAALLACIGCCHMHPLFMTRAAPSLLRRAIIQIQLPCQEPTLAWPERPTLA